MCLEGAGLSRAFSYKFIPSKRFPFSFNQAAGQPLPPLIFRQ